MDGQTGLLVADDLDAFIAATQLLLEDAALRQRLGAAARERALQFAWSTTADAFLTVVRTAVSGGVRHDSDPVDVVDLTAPEVVDLTAREVVDLTRQSVDQRLP